MNYLSRWHRKAEGADRGKIYTVFSGFFRLTTVIRLRRRIEKGHARLWMPMEKESSEDASDK